MMIRIKGCTIPNGHNWYKVHVGKTFKVTNAEKIKFEQVPKGLRKDQLYVISSENESFNGKLLLRSDCETLGAKTESRKSFTSFNNKNNNERGRPKMSNLPSWPDWDALFVKK